MEDIVFGKLLENIIGNDLTPQLDCNCNLFCTLIFLILKRFDSGTGNCVCFKQFYGSFLLRVWNGAFFVFYFFPRLSAKRIKNYKKTKNTSFHAHSGNDLLFVLKSAILK